MNLFDHYATGHHAMRPPGPYVRSLGVLGVAPYRAQNISFILPSLDASKAYGAQTIYDSLPTDAMLSTHQY